MPSMFSWLTKPNQGVPKKRHAQRQKINTDDEPLVVTLNMVSKGKKSVRGEHSSDTETKEPLHYTRLRTRFTSPLDNKRLAGHFNEEDSDYSAIVFPPSYGSFWQGGTIAHMVDNSNNMNHRMEAQESLIQEQ